MCELDITRSLPSRTRKYRRDWRPGCIALLLCGASVAQASTVEISAVALALPGDTTSSTSGIRLGTPDGRYALVGSVASNIFAGQVDQNDRTDVFVFDSQTGTAALISHALGAPGTAANGISIPIGISDDGSKVLFHSVATDLLAGVEDNNQTYDVFLHDRSNDTTILVSRLPGVAPFLLSTPAGASNAHALSADGSTVLFSSSQSGQMVGIVDTNNGQDVFLFDVATGAVSLVSKSVAAQNNTANARSLPVALSADGARVLFNSYATNLVAGMNDSNSVRDVFLYDRATGINTLVSHVHGSPTTTPAGDSLGAGISGDGDHVVFGSFGTAMVPGQGGDIGNVFLHARATGINRLVSGVAGSTTIATGASWPKAISADGRRVLYRSAAPTLVAGQSDSNFVDDVFVFDRVSGETTLVSRKLGLVATTADAFSAPVAISADGSTVLFETEAEDILAGVDDANEGTDCYLFDLASGVSSLVSHASTSSLRTGNQGSTAAALSADGKKVLFQSDSGDLVVGVHDLNDVYDAFIYDQRDHAVALISRAYGVVRSTAFPSTEAFGMSADGRHVLLHSSSPGLVAGQVQARLDEEVLLADRGEEEVQLVSHAAGVPLQEPDGASTPFAVSKDGQRVLFYSAASNLVAGLVDSNGVAQEPYLWDRKTGATVLLSRSLGNANIVADGESLLDAISEDGEHVLFRSRATDIVAGIIDSSGTWDAFVYEVASGQSTLVSRISDSSTAAAGGVASAGAISGDGGLVLYSSTASNVVAGVDDSNDAVDAFLFDRTSAQTQLLSRSAGSAATTANGSSSGMAFSTDGNRILLASTATNLLAGLSDQNGAEQDLFLLDRSIGVPVLVSRALGSVSTTPNAASYASVLSADGRSVVFRSAATDLLPGMWETPSPSVDLFLFDATGASTYLVSRRQGSNLWAAGGGPVAAAISSNGGRVLYSSDASDVVPDVVDLNMRRDVFLFDLVAGTSLITRDRADPMIAAGYNGAGVAMNADGDRVLFNSWAHNHVAGLVDRNGRSDAFIADIRETWLFADEFE